MRRAAPVPTPDPGCSTRRSGYSTIANFESSLKPILKTYVDTVAAYTGDQYVAMRDSRDPAQNAQQRKALDDLQLAESNLAATIACLNKDILQRNTEASKIYTLQQEIEAKRKEAELKKQGVDEAKERSALLENPYSKTTWWEAWFPLGRPIRKENVPVLLSVSILMLVLSLGLFLKLAGFELRLEPLVQSSNSFLRNLNSRKYQ
jgi:hypothetical protein